MTVLCFLLVCKYLCQLQILSPIFISASLTKILTSIGPCTKTSRSAHKCPGWMMIPLWRLLLKICSLVVPNLFISCFICIVVLIFFLSECLAGLSQMFYMSQKRVQIHTFINQIHNLLKELSPVCLTRSIFQRKKKGSTEINYFPINLIL